MNTANTVHKDGQVPAIRKWASVAGGQHEKAAQNSEYPRFGVLTEGIDAL